ncbi:MAG: hypothetical protein R2862_05505 [Thermoanaerobaculia bacterium]
MVDRTELRDHQAAHAGQPFERAVQIPEVDQRQPGALDAGEIRRSTRGSRASKAQIGPGRLPAEILVSERMA